MLEDGHLKKGSRVTIGGFLNEPGPDDDGKPQSPYVSAETLEHDQNRSGDAGHRGVLLTNHENRSRCDLHLKAERSEAWRRPYAYLEDTKISDCSLSSCTFP